MPTSTKTPLNVTASTAVLNQSSSSDFKVGVRAQDDSVEMMIHGVIGDSWEALDSASVTAFLKANKGKPVNVDINSPGGLAYDGVSIYNALVQHDAAVNVDITGIAASAATIIAMAGDRIRIAENGSFMIHRAMAVAVGNQKVMLDVAEFLDKLDGQIAATYAARTGRKAETMLKLMDGTIDGTTFSGREAVDNGFATELIPLKKKGSESNSAGSPVTSELTTQFAAEARQRQANAVAARVAMVKLDDAA